MVSWSIVNFKHHFSLETETNDITIFDSDLTLERAGLLQIGAEVMILIFYTVCLTLVMLQSVEIQNVVSNRASHYKPGYV